MSRRNSINYVTLVYLVVVAWTVFAIFACGMEENEVNEPPRISDGVFHFDIDRPAYEIGTGPRVLIDEAHNNFHTTQGTYKPFASLIEKDGYVVERCTSPFTEKALSECDILVISDAMPLEDASSPISKTEIERLQKWVNDGGSLFLITDHYPDPDAVKDLAAAFEVDLHNGYAMKNFFSGPQGPHIFKREDKTLGSHPIVDGYNNEDQIEAIATFAGCAFKASDRYTPILILGAGNESWTPEKRYDFKEDTPRIDVEGWLQGAVAEFGKGRVACFGEAAMFTAQLFGPEKVPVGMNAPVARDNARFLLNVMHWLSEDFKATERPEGK